MFRLSFFRVLLALGVSSLLCVVLLSWWWQGVLWSSRTSPVVRMLHFANTKRDLRLRQQRRFSVLSYNVHGLPPLFTGDNTPRRLRRIGALLNGFDLVTLQENFAYTQILMQGVTLPHRFHATRKPWGRFYASGLSTLTHLRILAQAEGAWPVCHGMFGAANDCLAAKGWQLLRVQLVPDDPNTVVDVYNLHMDAGHGLADQAVRRAQIQTLSATIRDRSRGRAVIVSGDTNLSSTKAVDRRSLHRLERSAGLRDACRAVSCPEPTHIDRILFRDSRALQLSALRWRRATRFVDDKGHALSDHPAILVVFGFRVLSHKDKGGG